MRNGKHYVSVRLTKAEKEYFLSTCKSCDTPKSTDLPKLAKEIINF